MKQELINLIEQKSPGAKPLYLVIRGSHAYGTNIETSDKDFAGVYIQSIDDILGSSYKEQINDDKNDTVIYEIRRFLELIASNNPNILELLNTPEDIYISINLEEHGKVDVVYVIDKVDIAVFKESNCILTTHEVDKSIVTSIINKIKEIHDKDINDIVSVFGFIMNRKEFENLTKIKIEDLGKIKYNNELSDIDKIIKSNEVKFNIDDILDKISSIGIESLTKDEKEFLEKYSKI